MKPCDLQMWLGCSYGCWPRHVVRPLLLVGPCAYWCVRVRIGVCVRACAYWRVCAAVVDARSKGCLVLVCCALQVSQARFLIHGSWSMIHPCTLQVPQQAQQEATAAGQAAPPAVPPHQNSATSSKHTGHTVGGVAPPPGVLEQPAQQQQGDGDTGSAAASELPALHSQQPGGTQEGGVLQLLGGFLESLRAQDVQG